MANRKARYAPYITSQLQLAEKAVVEHSALKADCYLALLPSSLPAAFALSDIHKGMVICDNVENVDREKHTVAPKYSPQQMRVINQLAYSGLREADKLIAVGEEIGTKLKTFNRPTLVVENFRNYTISTRTEILKDTIGLSSDDKILVLSGSVVQGLENLLEALTRLPKTIHLVGWFGSR